MANEVAKPVFGGSVVIKDMKAMAEKAQESAQNSPRGGAPDGSDYLNFSGKQGKYTIGQDNRVITSDELWVVNVASFEDGWVCWKGGKPAASRMANIYNGIPVPAPDMSELGPFDTNRGDGWFQAKAMVIKSLDNDQQGYHKINSISGTAEMADLVGEFSKRAAAGLPCWPVIYLDMEKFQAQGFTNFKPQYKVYGWLSDDQLGLLDDPDCDIDALISDAAAVAEPPKVEDKSAGGGTSRRRRSA